MKKLLQSYFGFTKKELNGLLVLCILLILVSISPFIYERFSRPDVHEFADFEPEVRQFLASAKRQDSTGYSDSSRERDGQRSVSYFNFDPNGLDEASWKQLGLSSRQIRVIKNYEAKGGRFHTKEDLKKIYSISEQKYLSLEPYIRIANDQRSPTGGSNTGFPKYESHKTGRVPVMVELNAADSAELETIRGIGPAFASRIVRYRNRLGGFYRKEQLRDVYGVDSLKYEELKDQVVVNPAVIRKINVNKASFEEIKNHPYLSYKQMNAVIQYRKQHGEYRSIADLKKIAIMDDEILRKIEPYLIFNDPDQT